VGWWDGGLIGCIPEMRKGSGAFGARVQAAIGLQPWAAPVQPTERAGSEGSVVSLTRQRKPYNRACGV